MDIYKKNQNMEMDLFRRKKPFMGMRGIHLDFKGLPPTPERLPELLEIMAGVGINCVLVEWEDAYPWTTYPELRSQTAYSKNTVERFLSDAERLSIEVIPLIQSLGHLETVLAKNQFKNLRELDNNVSELCPCKKGSRELIISLVDDILKTHQGRIKYFHLGGDEAWTMGSCIRCKKVVKNSGKAALYLRHMFPLLEYLQGKNIRPILWDDMMREWPVEKLEKISGKTDLMVWKYPPKIPEGINNAMTKFSEAGITMWGASAFKGAAGIMADIPDISDRTENILSWIGLSREHTLKGIVATGWSRYNSFLAPCESIETSIDSMVLSAWAMQEGGLPPDAKEKVRDFLNRGRMKKLAGKRFFECLYAGGKIQQWKNESIDLLKSYWVRSASIYGEKDRRNPYEEDKIACEIRECLVRGKKLTDSWLSAHKGLVPEIWLKYYAKSRLWQFENYAARVLKNLSRK